MAGLKLHGGQRRLQHANEAPGLVGLMFEQLFQRRISPQAPCNVRKQLLIK